MSHLLDDILQAQKRGEARGIPSICSAHPWVLKAVMQCAARTGAFVLVESTCNQVNQFGGYTGMTPAKFVRFVRGISIENGLPPERLILGGDHLGPSPWQERPAEHAMQKAADMVRAYVQAGYTKIHLDASMTLRDDDPSRPLDLELAARRTAWLAKAAEAAADPATAPRYVIGTEVPIPGGATAHEDGVRVTTVEDARRTLEVTREAFLCEGLEAAWERVIALVVQPGVEFGDDFVLDYQPDAARDLARFSETISFVYEAHSTDYQTRENLRNLVRNHFAILKVGPALTFVFREAVFALAMMESELFPADVRSNIIQVLNDVMVRHPEHWKKYYSGAPAKRAFKRKFSLSDRSRHYWTRPEVQASLDKLLANLGESPLPLGLVSQYLPIQYKKIRDKELEMTPEAIVLDHIETVLSDYS